MPTDSDRPLSPRQETFAREVATGRVSYAEAARRSGYSTASGAERVRAAELVANTNVQRRIQEHRASLTERAGIDAVKVLRRIDSRADDAKVPAAVRQRADESLLDVLQLRQGAASVTDNRVQVLATLGSSDLAGLARLLEAAETP